MTKLIELHNEKAHLSERYLQIKQLQVAMYDAEEELMEFRESFNLRYKFMDDIIVFKKLEKYITSEPARLFINQLYSVTEDFDRTISMLNNKYDEAKLQYALKLCDVNIGDIIEFKDDGGRECKISVSGVSFTNNGFVKLWGYRLIKNGNLGKVIKSCNIDVTPIQNILDEIDI